jgi:hypothetical protein
MLHFYGFKVAFLQPIHITFCSQSLSLQIPLGDFRGRAKKKSLTVVKLKVLTGIKIALC